jgi:competence protein ComEA
MPHASRSQLAAYALIAALVLFLGGRWLMKSHTPAATAAPPGAARAAYAAQDAASAGGGGLQVTQPSRALIVDVAGAVHRPGVYRLPGGSRVKDAVARAGGATAKGDPNGINLAAPLQDGTQVVVPAKGAVAAAAVAPGATAAGAPAGPPVNLNTATPEQLDTLDGVGPATAQKIIEYRTQHGGFRTVDDLGQVPGIGPKKLAALRGKVQV